MEQSPYLLQALQSMRQPPPQPAQPAFNITPEQINAMAKEQQTWSAANPGQSYLVHAVKQAGDNLMAAPGNLVQGLAGGAQSIASIPGHLAGLFGLGRAGAP